MGAAAAPLILPKGLKAADEARKPLTMGFIGMGKQNGGLMRNFLSRGTKVAAVCDVDSNRRNNAKKSVDEYYKGKGVANECVATAKYEDIIERDDIDAVCIATPDH